MPAYPYRSSANADTELLIFITPTVLPYPGDNAVSSAGDSSDIGVTP